MILCKRFPKVGDEMVWFRGEVGDFSRLFLRARVREVNPEQGAFSVVIPETDGAIGKYNWFPSCGHRVIRRA